MNERLESALRKLRLSGLAQSLQVRLEEAIANRLTHAEFLELILQDELAVRSERQIQRRTKAAAFRELKTLVVPPETSPAFSPVWPPVFSREISGVICDCENWAPLGTPFFARSCSPSWVCDAWTSR